MNRKGQGLSLKFLMGLLFTVMLILMVLKLIGNISLFFDPHLEKDLINSWVEEIQTLEEGYSIQLLPLQKIKTDYIILFFQINSEKTNLPIPNEKTKEISKFKYKCKTKSCICAYSYKKKKITYCKTIDKNKESKQLVSNLELVPFYDGDGKAVYGVTNNPSLDYNSLNILYTKFLYAQSINNKVFFCKNLEGNGKCIK